MLNYVFLFFSETICNETLVKLCYDQFDANSTDICKAAQNLKRCVNRLKGCHEMKHPSYTLSLSILHKYGRCFFVNYSKLLEVLEKKHGE